MAFLVKGYQSTLSAERWLAHTTQVERQLHGLRESLVRESAEVRAYLLEGNSEVFTSLDKTTQEFSSSIATLRGLTRDNPGQQERVDQLERELQSLMALVTRILERRGTGQYTVAVLRELDDARGRVRNLERAMIEEENRLYDERFGTLVAAIRVTLGGTLAAGALALASFLILVRFVRSDAADWTERSLNEARLRGLTSRMNEIELVLETDGAIVEANDRALEAYGYSREEIQRRNVRDLRAPPTMPLVERQIAQAAIEEGIRFETEHVRRDGTTFPVQVSARRFQVGRASYLHSIVRDLTEERRAALQLRKSDLLYHAMAQNFPNGVMALFDHDLRYVLVDGAGSAAGGPNGSLVGRTLEEIYTPEERERFEPAFRAALRGESTDLELEVRGGEREVHVRPVKSADGTVLMGIATSVDISARKTTERALRESEARYASLVRNFPNGVVGLFDGDLRYVMMDGTNTIGPSDPRSWVGRTLQELCPPEKLPDAERAYRSALAGESARFEIELQGHVLDTSTHPVREADGTVRLGVVMTQDVTARRKAEAALRRSELLHRAIAHHFPNGVVGLFDQDLRYLLVDGQRPALSPDLARHVGKTVAEALPSEVAMKVEPLFQDALRGQGGQLELVMNGRVLEIAAHPVRDESGAIVMGLFSSQDVTEFRALQSRRAAESRISAMATLVAGMAHEINNPLAGEMSGVGLAIEEVREIQRQVEANGELDRGVVARELGEALEVLEDAQGAAERIAQLVRDLKLFGRPDSGRGTVRLAEVAEEAHRRTMGTLREGTTVRLELSEAPVVSGVVEHLERVIENLLSNAARAIPAGRRGAIVLRVAPGSPGMVRLDVEDDGAGISADVMKRVFDPFFTTHGVGGGTGLGLSICQAIIHAHGGTIAATSEPGKGTLFRVELPVAKC